MSPRSEVHAYFAKADTRIPPYACYEHEDTRPYYEETLLTFHLKKDIEIPDTSGNEGGTTGGDNGLGRVLPPIIYPTAPIDVSDGRIACGRKSMPGPDSCATDSSEDGEGEDTRKLTQIAQAIHKGQPVTIAIRGQFQGLQQSDSEVLFQRDHKGTAPADILEPFRLAIQEILALSTHYQTEGMPG
jgi:hypothetical protein